MNPIFNIIAAGDEQWMEENDDQDRHGSDGNPKRRKSLILAIELLALLDLINPLSSHFT